MKMNCIARWRGRANTLIGPLIVFSIAAPPFGHRTIAGESGTGWQEEWEKTVRAAEQEGQLVLYSLSEVGDVIANGGFQKRFPQIKISVVGARGGEHVSRIMA